MAIPRSNSNLDRYFKLKIIDFTRLNLEMWYYTGETRNRYDASRAVTAVLINQFDEIFMSFFIQFLIGPRIAKLLIIMRKLKFLCTSSKIPM